ncbi:MAG: iron ABC transporter permease [Clostridiales bacterium]|nr:iron ABC transporter permease [Clostridiales bacterium]
MASRSLKTEHYQNQPGWARWLRLAGLPALLLVCLLACVALGSVSIPLGRTAAILWDALLGRPAAPGVEATIILTVRLPRVLSVLLVGAALSLCGAAMQGLLRNPLADGATLGVSSGASLGAMLAILLGFQLPGLPLAGTALMSVFFASFSLLLVLALAFALDRSLSTSTIILIGVIYTMFTGSLMSLLISFSGTRLRPLTFWTLGSLTGAGYNEALFMLLALIICGSPLLAHWKELDAFAMGEENARHIGVPVRQVKMTIMVAVSLLIGISVSIGGSIGFVGLVIPHITRLITGPSHRRLLGASVLLGGVFLMLCDLAARTLLSPIELPLGVVTSLIGAVFFVVILTRSRGRAA